MANKLLRHACDAPSGGVPKLEEDRVAAGIATNGQGQGHGHAHSCGQATVALWYGTLLAPCDVTVAVALSLSLSMSVFVLFGQFGAPIVQHGIAASLGVSSVTSARGWSMAIALGVFPWSIGAFWGEGEPWTNKSIAS